MTRAYVGIGSNIDPDENVKKAFRLLSRAVLVTNLSTVYRTDPIERPDQSSYYNCVVELETDQGPEQLKYGVLRIIEEKLGRVRSEDRNAARTIDLDLLLYDDLVLSKDGLTVPDPDILERPFLLIALAEIAPDLRVPGTVLPIRELARSAPRTGMEPLVAYTEEVRKESARGNEHGKGGSPGQGTAEGDRRRP